jgi:hypothetical protein
MLDDIGTKAKAPELAPSAILETSEGNYQYLYFLEPYELSNSGDIDYFEACNRAVVNAGYGDTGSQGVNRIYRLPASVNTKEGRGQWQTTVTYWQPNRCWELSKLMDALELDPVYKEDRFDGVTGKEYVGDVPDGFSDSVLDWLQEQGLLGERRSDFFDIKCPWSDQHTTGNDTAGYSPLGVGPMKLLRGFNCFHGHCAHRTANDFLAWVQSEGGPGALASGISEIEAERLREEKRRLTQPERIAVLYASLPPVYRTNLPDVAYTANGNVAGAQRPTRPNVQYLIDTLGVQARMDMQEHKVEYSFRDDAISEFIDHPDEIERVVLDAGQRCGLGGVSTELLRISQEMALNDKYHPMAEWIASKPWDKNDRFIPLANSVHVDSIYADVWPRYLKRWLIQGVQAVMGWQNPQQMRGCVVFAGDQEIGKSRWFASLVPDEYFLEGAHIELQGGAAKDSIMQTTAYPIVELGELETTFGKSATGQLKAFLAMKKDVYRAPYDTKPRSWPRCTIFCGTVNRMDFLVDETGSTRFWPVWVDQVNPQHGIDMQQLWAQVYSWWRSGETWWLDEAESATRAQQAEEFEVTTDVKEALVEWLKTHKWPGNAMNVTNIAKILDVNTTKQNLSQLRVLLTRYLGKPKRQLDGVANAWDVPTTNGKNVKFDAL